MTKTLLIGLDGATFTLLDGFMRDAGEEGQVMPYLAQLMAEGYSATLKSTAHPLTPPAWTSVCTGRTPGHHGVLDFVRFEDLGDDVYFTLYDSRDIRVETFWERASREGASVVALNFPMMAPPPQVNGALVPGFVSWKHLRRNMHPPELFDRIAAIDGFDARELSWDFEREGQIGELMGDQELHSWVEKHLPRDKQWFNIARTLLREDNPDIMAVMLDGTDKIQHQAWHVLDPAYWDPATATDAQKAVRALVLQYFRELDGYVRALHEAAGPEAHLVIVSDHGFTGADKVVRINRYLGELGHLVWRESDGSEAARRRDLANFANMDWSQTRAFCPTPSSNGIVIRRQSESCPAGVPEAEYEAFREQLIRDLYALTDPETGKPVIAGIMKREEHFPGEAMESVPDLVLTLADHGFVSVRNRAPAVVTRPVPMGTHHPDGIFVMTGPGVERRRGPAMSIVDTTSIMAYTAGLEVPSDYEGRIPATLFSPDWLRANPVRMGAATAQAPAPRAEEEASAEQKEEVLAQLRLLGYLED